MQVEQKRGPGRPKKEAERRRRKQASSHLGRLGVNPGLLDFERYQYRFVNDDPGRIHALTQQDDYDLIPDGGEKEDNTDLGNMVSVVVGTHPDGKPKRAFLARKPREFYEMDKKAEQEELDRQLTELRRGNDKHGGSQSDYVGAISMDA